MSQWDEIDRNDFEGDMQELVDIVGLAAVKKLLTVFGGESIYFPKPESVIRAGRDRRIYKEFNGFNLRALAVKYNLTTRQIRVIIKEQRQKHPKSNIKEMDLF